MAGAVLVLPLLLYYQFYRMKKASDQTGGAHWSIIGGDLFYDNLPVVIEKAAVFVRRYNS